jgi:hypothetical protein
MQGLALSDMARGATNRQDQIINFLEFLADTAYPLPPKKQRSKPAKKATVAAKAPAKKRPATK